MLNEQAIYVADSDRPLWEEARELAGEGRLSGFVTQALREFVERKRSEDGASPAARAAALRRMAATNDLYAARCEETFANTGRESALNQAEIQRQCAAEKRARADELERPVV